MLIILLRDNAVVCCAHIAVVFKRLNMKCLQAVTVSILWFADRTSYQYTTSVDINNKRYKRTQSVVQNHMRHVRSESAREQRIALYKSCE